MALCGSSSQKGSASTQLPAWYENAVKSNVGKAGDLAARPYPQYTAPRLADFTPDQLAGFDKTRATAGQYQPYLDQAGSLLQKFGGMTWADADQQSYMNPYQQQVTAATVDELRRQGEVSRAQIERDATAASAWGDARHGVVEAEQRRNEGRTIADTIATGNAAAYDRAQQAFNTDRAAQMAAAGGMVDFAGTGAQLGYADAAALLGIGGQQQNQGQASLDLAYQDFLREKGYPMEMVNFMTSTLQGSPYSSTTTTTQPGGNAFAQNLGAFGALAGGLGMLSDAGGFASLWPF